MEPRANHDLLPASRAGAAGGLQPQKRIERALTEHVEPPADVKAGGMRGSRLIIVN